MTLRNFWLTTEMTDTHVTASTGPRTKQGGFDLQIEQRSKGEATTVLQVEGRVNGDELVLKVFTVNDGFKSLIGKLETVR